MFERLFPRKPAPAAPLPQPNSQLALGALLVRVALADQKYKLDEVKVIDEILAATFDIGPIEAAKLRGLCTDLERHAAEPDEFTAIVRDAVSYDDRLALASAMWRVVLADGERVDIEEDRLHEIETALEITASDSAKARQAALGAGA